MTWRTSEGSRVLLGNEGELVRDVLAIMVDRVSDNVRYDEEETLFEFHVELFDSLTPTEQVAVIHQVARHLLVETPDTLELTSLNESAVYAIFRTLAVEIEIEIDTENEPQLEDEDPDWLIYWRSRTLKAFRECFADELDDEDCASDDPESPWRVPQTAHSRNLEQWDLMTESLADRILWDRDFEMASSFLDAPPEKAALMKQMLGIETEYYSDAARDIRPGSVDRTLNEVRKITHQKPR